MSPKPLRDRVCGVSRFTAPAECSPVTVSAVVTGSHRRERNTMLTGKLERDDDEGAATAEYAIATMAAVGFAGLLVVIMRSDEVRQILTDLVRSALTFTG